MFFIVREDKTYTEKELNELLEAERKKFADSNKKLLDELNALKTKTDLTVKEREELDAKIEALSNELLTKEELAAKEREKLTKTHAKELETFQKERDMWRSRYTEATIIRAISDAATSHNAVSAEQIVAMLRGNTTLEEVQEDGKPTGDFIPKVKYNDIGKDGKPVVLNLSVPEAVARMKDTEKYYNLFKGEGTGGTGSTNRPNTKARSLAELAKNPEEYRKARESGEVKF